MSGYRTTSRSTQRFGSGVPSRAMSLTRRTFLGGSAIAALTTACGGQRAAGRVAQGPAVSEVTLDAVIARALDTARKGGASYADVRIVRRRVESVRTREDHVVSVGADETYGIGVRVSGTASAPKFKVDTAAAAGLIESGLPAAAALTTAATGTTTTTGSAVAVRRGHAEQARLRPAAATTSVASRAGLTVGHGRIADAFER